MYALYLLVMDLGVCIVQTSSVEFSFRAQIFRGCFFSPPRRPRIQKGPPFPFTLSPLRNEACPRWGSLCPFSVASFDLPGLFFRIFKQNIDFPLSAYSFSSSLGLLWPFSLFCTILLDSLALHKTL